MIPLESGGVVVMPLWVFLVLVVVLVGLNAFLMWCNHDQASTIRRQRHRREVHDHLHHDGPPPVTIHVDPALGAWNDQMSDRVIERLRRETGGGR